MLRTILNHRGVEELAGIEGLIPAFGDFEGLDAFLPHGGVEVEGEADPLGLVQSIDLVELGIAVGLELLDLL